MITLFKTLFLSCILSMSAATYANIIANDKSIDKEKIILTVAVEEIGYFPFNYTENGKVKGFSVDFLEYIEANSKYDFEFIILPWSRSLHLVTQGEVDVILALFKTPEREKVFHFIEPSYGNEANQLFSLIDNNIEFTGQLQQLKPFSIGMVRDYSYGKTFDQADYLKKLPALSEAVLLKLLLGKRTDLVISNPLIFKQLMQEQGVSSKIKAIKPYVDISPIYMAITRNRKDAVEIKRAIGKLTQQFKKSASYQTLLEKYQLNYK